MRLHSALADRGQLLFALLLACIAIAVPLLAQPPFTDAAAAAQTPATAAPSLPDQWRELAEAARRLPLAAALAALLALRPQRRGTPKRRPAVVQTQIILAVIGALVMMVVGSSLARAFGIVGAAGLVRYRAKVDDPKDAGVMLGALAIGLASGVGQWVLAIFGTIFILAVLWTVESFEPVARRRFLLRVKSERPEPMKARIERLLEREEAKFEIRAVTPGEVQYEVSWQLERDIDRLSERIAEMDRASGTEVEIEPIKDK